MTRDDCALLGEEISAHLLEYFKRAGISRDEACALSEGVSDELLKLYAGQNIRFPARRWKEIDERNAEIIRRFDGTNAPILAVEFSLSRETIWRIVKSEKETSAG